MKLIYKYGRRLYVVIRIMTNLSASKVVNISQAMTNITLDDKVLSVPPKVSYIIAMMLSSIICPFTIVLNVLVIMAVKRRPRLQSCANILLACLAVTDALTGLLVQPTFIIWRIFQVLGGINTDIVRQLHLLFLLVVTFSSGFHLMLVTCERLIAIKYTMHYPHLVTTQNIKVAVTSSWVLALSCSILWPLPNLLSFNEGVRDKIGKMAVSFILSSCVVFMTASYVILYRETAYQKNKIKTQQLPREEVERFAKERKALKTTVYVVGAVLLCLSPAAISTFVSVIANQNNTLLGPWSRVIVMLNSLLNPLIYCWRQKEMRLFVFRMSSPAVAAVN